MATTAISTMARFYALTLLCAAVLLKVYCLIPKTFREQGHCSGTSSETSSQSDFKTVSECRRSNSNTATDGKDVAQTSTQHIEHGGRQEADAVTRQELLCLEPAAPSIAMNRTAAQCQSIPIDLEQIKSSASIFIERSERKSKRKADAPLTTPTDTLCAVKDGAFIRSSNVRSAILLPSTTINKRDSDSTKSIWTEKTLDNCEDVCENQPFCEDRENREARKEHVATKENHDNKALKSRRTHNNKQQGKKRPATDNQTQSSAKQRTCWLRATTNADPSTAYLCDQEDNHNNTEDIPIGANMDYQKEIHNNSEDFPVESDMAYQEESQIKSEDFPVHVNMDDQVESEISAEDFPVEGDMEYQLESEINAEDFPVEGDMEYQVESLNNAEHFPVDANIEYQVESQINSEDFPVDVNMDYQEYGHNYSEHCAMVGNVDFCPVYDRHKTMAESNLWTDSMTHHYDIKSAYGSLVWPIGREQNVQMKRHRAIPSQVNMSAKRRKS